MGSWSDAQSATRAGEADMIIGVYYNDERNEYLEYVDPPFVYDPVQVFVANDQTFEFLGQELHGHATAEPGVLGLVDDAHAAAPELIDDAVVGDAVAGGPGDPRSRRANRPRRSPAA